MTINERDLINFLQDENRQMKELIEFTHNNLSMLFRDLDKGVPVDTKRVVAFIGKRVEGFLNERTRG